MLNESNQQNEATSNNCGSPKKSLSFKEWKSLKDHQKNTGNRNVKLTVNNKSFVNTNSDIRNELNHNISNNFPFNSRLADFPPLYTRNFNGFNFSNRDVGGSNFEPLNNYSRGNNFCGYSISSNRGNTIVPNKFTDSNELQNGIRKYNCGYNNSNRGNSFDQSKNFFTSDCAYPQRDMINKPVSNPFRDSQRNMINEPELNPFRDFNRDMINKLVLNPFRDPQRDIVNKPELNPFRYPQRNMINEPELNPFRDPQRNTRNKHESKPFRDDGRNVQKDKKAKTVKKPNKQIAHNNADVTFSADTKKNLNEPEVYITNPKARLDGKPYIPKPKIPEQDSKVTYEERKQQWKEYRQAMKPFKNRDFHNAKRVVQRLGKQDRSELNDKQLFRLINAKECIAVYKAHLNAKYPNYVKAEESNCNNLGEVYVLKTVPINQSNTLTKSSIQQNRGDFSNSAK